MSEDKTTTAHLQIHDRTAAEGPPIGHTVRCPAKGWVSIVRCFECQELVELGFEPSTCASYLTCTPQAAPARSLAQMDEHHDAERLQQG